MARASRNIFTTVKTEGGLLPWSAAAVYPELMRQLAGRRPLFPLMNWYWKMTQMIPDATPDVRWRVAADLATWEIVQPTREGRKRLELFLLWSPWRVGWTICIARTHRPGRFRRTSFWPDFCLKLRRFGAGSWTWVSGPG